MPLHQGGAPGGGGAERGTVGAVADPALLSLLIDWLGPDAVEIFRPEPWMRDAACREHPEVDWFPTRGDTATAALAICAGCLVRDECGAYAEAAPTSLSGIWGGKAHRTRLSERRRRRRATRQPTTSTPPEAA